MRRDRVGSLLGSSQAWPQSCVLLLAPGCDTHPLDSFPDLVGQPTSASGWLWGLGERAATPTPCCGRAICSFSPGLSGCCLQPWAGPIAFPSGRGNCLARLLDGTDGSQAIFEKLPQSKRWVMATGGRTALHWALLYHRPFSASAEEGSAWSLPVDSIPALPRSAANSA